MPTLTPGKIKCKLTADCALHAFFFVVCAVRPIRSDFRGCLDQAHVAFQPSYPHRFRPRSWPQRHLAARKQWVQLRFGSQRQPVPLSWPVDHKLAIRKMKTMDTSRLLASTKHHNSTGQDGSGKLTLMFACFCLSYHAQQAFANGQGSLMPSPSPFAKFFSSLRSFRSLSSRARLWLENG